MNELTGFVVDSSTSLMDSFSTFSGKSSTFTLLMHRKYEDGHLAITHEHR